MGLAPLPGTAASHTERPSVHRAGSYPYCPGHSSPANSPRSSSAGNMAQGPAGIQAPIAAGTASPAWDTSRLGSSHDPQRRVSHPVGKHLRDNAGRCRCRTRGGRSHWQRDDKVYLRALAGTTHSNHRGHIAPPHAGNSCGQSSRGLGTSGQNRNRTLLLLPGSRFRSGWAAPGAPEPRRWRGTHRPLCGRRCAAGGGCRR